MKPTLILLTALLLAPLDLLQITSAAETAPKEPPPIEVRHTMPRDGKVTLAIDDAFAPATGRNIQAPERPLAWPPLTRECRPWAYHWWLGSAVDRENLTREFKRYREGGLGGLHIVPIYGAKGAEIRYLPYLSADWMAMLEFAVKEGEANDLGIDMTTGTGWNFGGPNISADDASLFAFPRLVDAPAARGPWTLPVPRGERVLAATAFGVEGLRLSISDQVTPDGRIDWPLSSSGWHVAFLLGRNGMKVKRAAPGGEGLMLNPIAPVAMRHYLERFTRAFAAPVAVRPRAMYHDSYEYHMGISGGGEWSPDFFEQFKRLRGYDLAEKLPELVGAGDPDIVARIRSDYRETVSDLMIGEVFPRWVDWCHHRGIRTRNQAHGSPASVLDFYALSDIPECEGSDERAKLASSAAHVMGRRLVSCESCTWLDEHFNETFDAMKRTVDYQLVRGVNHIFYHGCVYSPEDAAWPGWLFYAASEMNPRNPLWREAPALNAYVARAQSVLQSGKPDDDGVLLYNALYDLWHDAKLFAIHKGTAAPSGHGSDCSLQANTVAKRLWESGVAFDWITDRLLSDTRVDNGQLRTPGSSYRAIVIPPIDRMPLDTARRLLALANNGATVIFAGALPRDVPGFKDHVVRRAELHRVFAALSVTDEAERRLKVARVGQGRVMIGEVLTTLAAAGVARETLVDAGLEFVRRRLEDGRYYFLINPSRRTVETVLTLATPARYVVALDPLTGCSGVIVPCNDVGTRPTFALYLEPGRSIILRTSDSMSVTGPVWRWSKPTGQPIPLEGPWQVDFVAGGPRLPRPWRAERLASWTANGDSATVAFAGTAIYCQTFDLPVALAKADTDLILDLGDVREVARVRLNDHGVGTTFMAPYRLRIDRTLLRKEGNALEIEVTNLGANRIRDLDRRKVAWKIFNDANVMSLSPYWREKSAWARRLPLAPSGQGGRLDATNWPVQPSGLLGPVTLSLAALHVANNPQRIRKETTKP